MILCLGIKVLDLGIKIGLFTYTLDIVLKFCYHKDFEYWCLLSPTLKIAYAIFLCLCVNVIYVLYELMK